MKSVTADVHAVLQAGGRGERLRPATDSLPKALLPVRGTPIIERLLRQMAASGVRSFTVITGWLGDKIESHLRNLEDLPSDLELSFIRERAPVGNIGSLGALAWERRPILFAFGDLVTTIDFGELMTIHRHRRAQITLASHYESHKLTLGEIIAEGDKVVDYLEKPSKRFLICSGICGVEPRVLSLIPVGKPSGISDLVRSAISSGLHVTHWVHGARWIDVNSPVDLDSAASIF